MANKNYEAKELRESISETKSGERIVNAKGFGKVVVRFPNNREKQMAEIEYSKMFTELIGTNLKTRAEMEEVLEKRGIWTAKEDEQVDRLQKSITDAFEKLAKAKSEKARQNALKDVESIRKEVSSIQIKRETYMSNTVESKAEDARIGYLASCVATYVDSGESVWESYDSFIDEENQEGLHDIVKTFLMLINGIPQSFLEQSPLDTELQEENGELDGE